VTVYVAANGIVALAGLFALAVAGVALIAAG
jgi:hypothetical protein